MPMTKGLAPYRAAYSGISGMMIDRPTRSTRIMTRTGRTFPKFSFSPLFALSLIYGFLEPAGDMPPARPAADRRDADHDQQHRNDHRQQRMACAHIVRGFFPDGWQVGCH